MQPMNAAPHRISRYWLFSGVFALAIAGLFSVVLVLARSPQFTDLIPLNDVFHTTLIIHVDLSITVWFLSIAGLIWAKEAEKILEPAINLPYFRQGGVILFFLGILAIAFSPLDGDPEPLMSNYVPVLTSHLFFIGLGLVAAGVIVAIIDFMLTDGLKKRLEYSWLHKAAWVMAVMALIAFFYFERSWAMLQADARDTNFYNNVFWAGGHILQFLFTFLLIVAWFLLVERIYGERQQRLIITLIFLLSLFPVLGSLHGFLTLDMNDQSFYDYFTRMMIHENGVAPALALLFIFSVMWRKRAERVSAPAMQSYLWSSLVLFGYGGILGLLISGQNVTIPAHYHGSLVGVTIAMMGLVAVLLPRYGYRDVAHWKLAIWQPIVLAFGQILHISGLAYSGGYGVLRKTPGGMENLPANVKAALGMMGMGGLLAIIGGLMFIIVVWRAVFRD